MTDNQNPPTTDSANPLDVLSGMAPTTTTTTPATTPEPPVADAQAMLDQAAVSLPAAPSTTPEPTPAPEVTVESAFSAPATLPTMPPVESPTLVPPPVSAAEPLTLTEHPINMDPANELGGAMPLPSVNDAPQPMPLPTSEVAPAASTEPAPIVETAQPTPAVTAEAPTTPPPASDPKELEKKAEAILGKPKKKMSPKIKIAAAGLAMMVVAAGIGFAVLGPSSKLATTKSVTSKDASACVWVETDCGSGCADNKDLYNCRNRNPKNDYVDPKTVKNITNPDGTINDSWKKATTGCDTTSDGGLNCSDEAKKIVGKAPDTVISQVNQITGNSEEETAGQPPIVVGTTCSAGAPDGCDFRDGWIGGSGACYVCRVSSGAEVQGSDVTYCGTEVAVNYCCSIDRYTGDTRCNGITPNPNIIMQGQGVQCDDQGCTLSAADVAAGCGVFQYECADGATPCNQNPKPVQTSAGSTASIDRNKCGSQQIDIRCGNEVAVRDYVSIVNKDCNKTTTTTTTTTDETPPPTLPPDKNLACTNLTSTLAAPKIGEAVTFSCNATSQGIAIASYEFRYKVGSGAWTDLTQTSTSSNTSKALTVTSAGVHTVECRACTAGNVCTPWTSTN